MSLSTPQPPPPDEEEYLSSEDSDFAPDAHQTTALSSPTSSDTEDDRDPTIKKPSKRKQPQEAQDLGFENSGDEAIIGKANKKRRKKGKGKDVERVDEEDDEGGEGGFVKTRAMRAAALPEEKKIHIPTAQSTLDIDALYKSMISAPLRPSPTTPSLFTSHKTPDTQTTDPSTNPKSPLPPAATTTEETITITRTYTFAGKTTTSTSTVPLHSAEARLHLASNPSTTTTALPTPSSPNSKPTILRPLAHHSRFEPPSSTSCDSPRRTDLRFSTTYIPPTNAIKDLSKSTASDIAKLNTVQKSALDWAQFVDKEDLKEDLEAASRRKGAYLDNRAFLDRVGERREGEGRRVRLGGGV